MTTVFFIFVGLVIFHFFWEGIIAPSVRMEIRYELFKMRDSIRMLKIQHDEKFDDQLFYSLQRMLNHGIALLHHATIMDFYRIYKNTDPHKLEINVERQEKLIRDCPISEVQDIWKRTVGITVLALIVNSGGWLVYIVPPILLWFGYSSVKRCVKLLFGLSENEVNQLFPPRPREVVMS
jgi:hypothetical protein